MRSRIHPVLFHLAWIIILSIAAYRRFALPQVPLIDNDWSGFLLPGLYSLAGHAFHQVNAREFLYPTFLYALLAVFRDFRAVAITQHLMGLGGGVLLFAAWCRARSFVRQFAIPSAAYYSLGLAVFAGYVLSPYPIYFECLMRPDVVCPFFAALTLFLLVGFLKAQHVDRHPGAAFGYGSAALFCAFLIPHLKPSYTLSAIFCTIPVWGMLFVRREKLWIRLRLVGVPLLAIALLLWWPAHHWRHTDRSTSSVAFLPQSLFSIHALIIRDQIADDLARPDPQEPYSPAQLRAVLAAIDSAVAGALKNSPNHFTSLGYDADYLLYHDPFFTTLSTDILAGPDATLEFCRYYYRRVWEKRPLAMLHKIGTQLSLFYSLVCPAYPDKRGHIRKADAVAWEIIQTNVDIRDHMENLPVGARYVAMVGASLERMPRVLMWPWMRDVMLFLQYCYTPSLVLFLLGLPWMLWTPPRRAHFALAATLLAVGYAFNFGNNLGVAILHTLEVSRYTLIQFVTTIFTQGFCFVVLAEALLVAVRPARLASGLTPSAPSAPSPRAASDR